MKECLMCSIIDYAIEARKDASVKVPTRLLITIIHDSVCCFHIIVLLEILRLWYYSSGTFSLIFDGLLLFPLKSYSLFQFFKAFVVWVGHAWSTATEIGSELPAVDQVAFSFKSMYSVNIELVKKIIMFSYPFSPSISDFYSRWTKNRSTDKAQFLPRYAIMSVYVQIHPDRTVSWL